MDAKRSGAGIGKRRKKEIAKAVSVVLALADLLTIALLVISKGNPIERIAIGAVVLAVSGEAIRQANGLDGGYGLYLLGSRHGIKAIDRLAKHRENAWNFIADFGLALGFGAFSYLLLRKRDMKAFVTGMLAIVFIILFVFPSLGIILEFIPLLSGGASHN